MLIKRILFAFLCLTFIFKVFGARPCTAPSDQFPFCNTSLSFQDRVKDLVDRLTLDEKVGLSVNGASGVSRLGIPGYQWWSEALHGVANSPGVHFQNPTPFATSFPQVISTAAGFNRTMMHTIGTIASTEARGMNNVGNAGLTFWAPNINIFRDPRWGRGQETPGEDPYLNSQYVINFVSGMQSGEDKRYIKASSCCKHYAAYSLENWHGIDRHHFNAIVTQQDLTDTYYPAFEACVSKNGGHASGIMCSYNAVNGIPSCANKELMTDLARNKWGFEGYITSDCGAVSDVLNTHHYTTNTDDTCNVVLSAGMDTNCGSFLSSNLKKAVQDGKVSQSVLDQAMTNLFLVQFRLGLFDPTSMQPYCQIPPSAVNTPHSQAVALLASLEAMTLLKNDKNFLPVSASKVNTVALIGPNANATTTLQGNYFGDAPYLISPLEGLKKFATVKYAKGCDIAGTNTDGFQAACDAASSSDISVLVVGLDQSQESEGHDRTSIDLPGVQNKLIDHVAACSKGSIVLVVMSGSSVDLAHAKSLSKVRSILWVGYPGQSGGDAIAKTIFGEYSPAGRLPFTMYPADYVNQVSMFDMGMRPSKSNPGRTYRFYQGTSIYPFGFGLSYTIFQYQWSDNSVKPVYISASLIDSTISQLFASKLSASPEFSSSVIVTNKGTRASDDVVLAFLVPPNPGKDGNPLKVLFGFERINLAPEESKTLHFSTSSFDLSLASLDGSLKTAKGEWKIVIGEPSQITRSVFVE